MSSAECATRCLVSNTCMADSARVLAAECGMPDRLEAGEILSGMMRRAGERARCDEEKAPSLGGALVSVELFRRDEAVDRGMLPSRLEILPDGEEIDVGRAEIVHDPKHLLLPFAQAHHHAGLGEQRRIERFGALEQIKRGAIIGPWTNAPIE